MAKVPNGEKKIAENFNRLSRAHTAQTLETGRWDDRQTTDDRHTDGRAIAYSEREREFTFSKKLRTSAIKRCQTNTI